jgi:hypothetical protein
MSDQEEIGKELLENLNIAWLKSVHNSKKPTIMLAFYKEQWFITINDSESVFRFVHRYFDESSGKYSGGVYFAVRSKCEIDEIQGEQVYRITENGALQLGIKKITSSIDLFGIETLFPIYLGNKTVDEIPKRAIRVKIGSKTPKKSPVRVKIKTPKRIVESKNDDSI